MTEIKYHLVLTSDAEPSSGFGTNMVDSLVPRNKDGFPFIPASHIKGLMRSALQSIPQEVVPGNFTSVIERLFGKPGADANGASLFSLTDLVAEAPLFAKVSCIKNVSRTSIDEKTGTAMEKSLRTAEVIASGTKFQGLLKIEEGVIQECQDILLLALLSIFEIGGNRNRGCGSCYVEIDNQQWNPSDLFTKVSKSSINLEQIQTAQNVAPCGSSEKQVFAKLKLTATSPLCFPETPIVGNNVVSSGWTIPASAIQGMILTRINNLNSEVATSCFNSRLFRAWPMFPVPKSSFDDGIPVRSSASHKISKLANDNDKYTFCDEKIEKYEWDKAPKNAPIKSADGVLIKKGNQVELWRSGEMARNLTAHGVINGERNLYTVEALDEKYFVGLIAMPEDAYNLLKKSLETSDIVQLGKSRTVRGSGKLEVVPLDSLPTKLPRSEKDNKDVAAFIVQSPILIDATPSEIKQKSADEIFADVLEKSVWGRPDEVSASIKILFGWNRHDKGLQSAKCVIAPGSVFRYNTVPCDLAEKLVAGIGEGRERGYGAVLLHPGIASVRLSGEKFEPPKYKNSTTPAKIGWELWRKNKKLSSSQIAMLQSRVDEGLESARAFLETRRVEGSQARWDRWKEVFAELKDLLNSEADLENVHRALKVWHDLSVANKKEEN